MKYVILSNWLVYMRLGTALSIGPAVSEKKIKTQVFTGDDYDGHKVMTILS
jgi:hypothetical protein